jgi:hypothetical protein
VKTLESEALMGRAASVLAVTQELIGTFRNADGSTTLVAETAGPLQQLASAPEVFSPDERPCPSCPVGRVRRARARTASERSKKEVTADRLFKCDECGWRGWLPPHFVGHATDVLAPDLTRLDSTIKSQGAAVRRSFSPRNLS